MDLRHYVAKLGRRLGLVVLEVLEVLVVRLVPLVLGFQLVLVVQRFLLVLEVQMVQDQQRCLPFLVDHVPLAVPVIITFVLKCNDRNRLEMFINH